MSDELLKNEGEDEAVEAHRHVRSETDEGSEEVEAHRHVRSASDDDDSDDVEAHRRQA